MPTFIDECSRTTPNIATIGIAGYGALPVPRTNKEEGDANQL